MEVLLLALCTFVSTTAGGLFAINNRRHMHLMMSFTAGVLLAVCFFDILPEAFRITEGNEGAMTPVLIAVVAGFLAIHTVEQVAVIHSGHEAEYAQHRHPVVGAISASALILHSFLDGVGIGAGFHVSSRVGLVIALAVIAHDFSDGLNTVALMLSNKNTLRRAVLFLVLDGLSPILGVLATFVVTIPESGLLLYLGFFVGFLLYIGASDILPEAHSHHSSYTMIGLTILGALFIFAVTRVT